MDHSSDSGVVSPARLPERPVPSLLGRVTWRAIQRRPDVLPARLVGQHPCAVLPGRVVPDVLGVTALQLGDPVPLFILMKTNDPALHARSARYDIGSIEEETTAFIGNALVPMGELVRLLFRVAKLLFHGATWLNDARR